MSFERWLKEIDKYSNQALIVHSVAVENIGVSIVRPSIYFLLERDARYTSHFIFTQRVSVAI